MDDRLKRIVDKQREHERRMREREEQRQREEVSKRREKLGLPPLPPLPTPSSSSPQGSAASSVTGTGTETETGNGTGTAATCQNQQQERRQTRWSPRRTAEERNGPTTRTDVSPATSEIPPAELVGWVKSEMGWAPIQTKVTNDYKVRPTKNFMPIWLYDQLKPSFALTQPYKTDFLVGCSLMIPIIRCYMTKDGQSLNKRIMNDLFASRDAIFSNAGHPLFVSRLAWVVKLFQCTVAKVEELVEARRKGKQPVKQETIWIEKIAPLLAEYQRQLEVLIPPQQPAPPPETCIIPNILEILDDNTMTQVLLKLTNVRDLLNTSFACKKLHALCSQQIIYHDFLYREFPISYSRAELEQRRSTLSAAASGSGTSWANITTVRSEFDWRTHYISAVQSLQEQVPDEQLRIISINRKAGGIALCTKCMGFFWQETNSATSCNTGTYEEYFHLGASFNPDNLVHTIISLPCPTGM
ncbi:hypothetical protein Pelo_6749 [Pelomyxa schiedti]|nr:hypothetical protein Pelo_6749 [Pelomyxa schiedti]